MTSLRDVRLRLHAQIGAAVHAALAQYSQHAALVTRTNPEATAAQVFDRTDVASKLEQGLAQAFSAVYALVGEAWDAGGGPPGSTVLGHLLQDVSAAFSGAADRIRTAASEAFESVPVRRFEPGVSEPGSQPLMESAHERSEAVADTIRAVAGRLVVSGRASADVAISGAQTAAALQEGYARQAAGEQVMKRWVSKLKPTTCHWCRQLHGMTIPLSQEFPHGSPHEFPRKRLRHVRTPAGQHRFHRGIGFPIIYTFPPRVWHQLLGPPRHPNCECELEIVAVGSPQPPPAETEQDVHPYLHASDIAAMPEAEYHGTLTFIRAAVHELRMLMRRLLGL